jgi:hypothetical protein
VLYQVNYLIMKRLALLTIVAILASFSLSAQEVSKEQKEKEVKQTKEQTQVQKDKQDTHGQVVSQIAKETPSGPGKGEVVSGTARSKSEAKKAAKAEEKKAKKEKKVKAPKERPIHENGAIQKGPRNTRPDAAGKEAGKGGAKPGKGRR